MTSRTAIATVLSGAALVATGVLAGTQISESTTTVAATTGPACGAFPNITDTGACQAAGVIAFVFWSNIQGAAQWCKWRDANPGEWTRIKDFARTAVLPERIVTWMGGAMRNTIEAYFAAGGTTWTIPPNTAPNACSGKVVSPPVVSGVVPGTTDVTVTVTTTP